MHPESRHHRWRTARLAVLLLAAGASISLAVAVILENLTGGLLNGPSGMTVRTQGDGFVTSRGTSFGADLWVTTTDNWNADPATRGPDVLREEIRAAVPAWVTPAPRPGYIGTVQSMTTTNAYGWPFVSAKHETAWGMMSGRRGPRGWWGHQRLTTPFGQLLVSYLPIPSGLALNTLIYATLLKAAVWGAARIRAASRRRAGRCAACGYSLEGLRDLAACPECGVGVSPSRKDSPG